MNAAQIAYALGDARREGRGWRCRCPLHQGRSLTLRDGDGGCVLVTCWGGCDRLDVLAELRGRGLLDGRTTGYWRPCPQTSQREDVARTARALAIWHEARPAGVSNEIVGGSFTAIDIDGVVLGTFDTLREPTRAFPERGGMR
jgi:putative DNA primase/helicase